MLQVQVDYWKMLENARHNRATEEAAFQQAQAASEQANVARQGLENAKLQAQAAWENALTNRANLAIGQQNADSNTRNAATNERNAAINEYNAAINAQNALSNAKQAEAAQRNAATNVTNAFTNQRQADIAAWNAAINEALLDIRDREVGVKEGELELDKEAQPYNIGKTTAETEEAKGRTALIGQQTETEKANTQIAEGKAKYINRKEAAELAQIKQNTSTSKSSELHNITGSLYDVMKILDTSTKMFEFLGF